MFWDWPIHALALPFQSTFVDFISKSDWLSQTVKQASFQSEQETDCTFTTLTTLPPSPDHRDALRDSWKATRALLDDFWDRWIKEYLPTLQKKAKWNDTTNRGPTMGQICLLMDDGVAREDWRLVRVKAIINTDTDHPRRFIVIDANKTEFDRHVRQLIPLELDIDWIKTSLFFFLITRYHEFVINLPHQLTRHRIAYFTCFPPLYLQLISSWTGKRFFQTFQYFESQV